ncbi:hypothetical protein EDB85DRAFT_1899227 [Lactarius pseudohatsudake]|nr:hypothetical protein EDB85DRAFT_1899227 [Lactarius pseudohatsudake]
MKEMEDTLRPATFTPAQKCSRATMEDAIFLLPTEQQSIFEERARTKRQRLDTNMNPSSHISPPSHTTPHPFFETVSPDTEPLLWNNIVNTPLTREPSSTFGDPYLQFSVIHNDTYFYVLSVCGMMSNDTPFFGFRLVAVLFSYFFTVITLMEHDLVYRRSQFLQSELYSPTSAFLSAVSWRSDRYGNVLVDRQTRGNAVASVVGRVLPGHLDCGPRGNFSNLGFGSLQTSKFQLHIGKPSGTVFATDFDKALANITTIQQLKASTGKSVNFIVMDGQETNLRFARNVYEKRPRRIGQSGGEYDRDSELSGEGVSSEEETVDSDTEHWPVPQELRSHLDGIKHEYRVAPLHVFKSDHQFVEPSNVNDVLEESLVEIRFELCHYNFVSKMEHSFNASIEQIVVLHPGVARPVSLYKRKDYRTGPIDLRVRSGRALTATSPPAGPSNLYGNGNVIAAKTYKDDKGVKGTVAGEENGKFCCLIHFILGN